MANDHRNGVPAGLVKRAIAAAEHDGTVRWTDGSGGSMCSKGCRSIAAGETPAGVVDQRFYPVSPIRRYMHRLEPSRTCGSRK